MPLKQQLKRVASPLLRPSQADFAPTGNEVFDSNLGQMFDQHAGRVANKWHQYLGVYDRLLADRRGSDVRLLELGVSLGGSLELWREYLGPAATIHGVDIDPACAGLSTDDLPVHIGSQADLEFLSLVVRQMGGVDVVIDDGSHVAKHQRASFDALWPLLPAGALYVVEDTHTSYWVRHGGGFRRPGTAIEMAKSMVDGLHGWYHRWPVGRRGRVAKYEVEAITFYDSLIVFEKRERRGRPVVLRRPMRT